MHGRRKFKQRSRCTSVRYCSANCQQSHWKQHKDLCRRIQQLSVTSSKNNVGLGDSEDDQMFVSHLTPKEKKTVAKLIGSKCLIHCHINGVESAVLLDTDTQVSIVSKQLVDVNFPSLQVKEIRELLGQSDKLNLAAANGTSIPYTGWILICLTFGNGQQESTEITVPFLVTEADIDTPSLVIML